MIFTKLKNSVSDALIFAGYSRTAIELLNLSDDQLSGMGISRTLLEQGASAYPWRVEVKSQGVSDNVTELNGFSNESEEEELDLPQAA